MDGPWKPVLLKRILPGLLFLGVGFLGLMWSFGGESQAGVFARALIGIGILIIGAIFLSGPIAQLIATPFVALLYPDDHSYSPPPIYRLPEMYVQQSRYQDAVAEYQKILRYHPQEIRAYLALLEVAFQHLQDIPLAEKTYKTGLRRLKPEADRAQLEETFRALQAGAPLATSAIASYP